MRIVGPFRVLLPVGLPLRDHGFDRDHHPFDQSGAFPGVAVIGNVRVFVHAASNPVTGDSTDNCVASAFNMGLDRMADIADVPANLASFDAARQRFTSGHE